MAELTVLRGGARTVLQTNPGTRLSDALKANGVGLPAPCGGRGVCGKCAVMLSGQVSPPNAAEQKAGARLACAGYGSCMPVTAAFGLTAASCALQILVAAHT